MVELGGIATERASGDLDAGISRPRRTKGGLVRRTTQQRRRAHDPSAGLVIGGVDL
jgi:hypothetical protein